MKENTNTPAVQQEKNITDGVLNRINQMMEVGALVLPKDYVPANALKAAWFKLLETRTKDKKPVLDVCSKESIANALLKMVTNAWNPGKSQCYFIAYGTELSCSPSYFGLKLAAKDAGMKDAVANVIYEGDEFEYEIVGGRTTVTRHLQKIENIRMDKIRGGYVVVEMVGGEKYTIIMTLPQIKKAWEQGQGEQNFHKNFPDMAVMKTVIARACRHIINTSNDAHLMDDDDSGDPVIDAVAREVYDHANQTMIGHAEEVAEITPFVEDADPVENIEKPLQDLVEEKPKF